MIGKTRHDRMRAAAEISPGPRTQFGQGCGILRHSAAPGLYRHRRCAPPDALAEWVEHFWIEQWRFDVPVPQTREVLPHPAVQWVFTPNGSRIFGVQRGRFIRQLVGQGRIFGVKFRPGMFHPFLREPVSTLASRSIAATDVFPGAADVGHDVLGGNIEGMMQAATQLLLAALPPMDPHAQRARRIVEDIADDSSLTRVEQVAARWDVHARTLQRLFDRHVGASPRWVIKRYRIYEALERIGATRWAELAQDLGYFDQAHFINDFRKLVGCSPSDYAKAVAVGA